MGKLPILLNCSLGDDKSSVFKCDHHLPFILAHEHLRAACCDNRINILTLAAHLYDVVTNYCAKSGIDLASILSHRPPYNHNDQLLCAQRSCYT